MKFRLIVDKQAEEQVVVTVHEPSTFTDKLEELVTGQSHRLTAYFEDTLVLLPVEQISCIAVLEGKTYAIDLQGRHCRLKQRLYELEQLLPSAFFRINKSTLANEYQLERFVATYSGGINARFKCGYEDYVSRRCFSAIKRRFDVK